MTQPTTGPATLAGIKAQASIQDDRLDSYVQTVADAVNVKVRALPIARQGDLGDADVDVEEWPDDVVLGANMLGSRLVRRRNSPSGVETFADQGAVYVQRNDPDVAFLLELGNYTRPAVG